MEFAAGAGPVRPHFAFSYGCFEKPCFHKQRHFKNPCLNRAFRSNDCGLAEFFEVPIWQTPARYAIMVGKYDPHPL